jgi:hypothetical protein
VRKPFSVSLCRALLPTNFGIERLVHVTESCRAHNKFHLVFVPKKKKVLEAHLHSKHTERDNFFCRTRDLFGLRGYFH